MAAMVIHNMPILISRFQKLIFIIFFTGLSAGSVYSQSGGNGEADRHALSTEAAATEDPERLAEYLTRPFNDETQKVRAIFRWIAEHIRYDTQAFFRSDSSWEEPHQVLRHRTAVCTGYANLFARLADYAGIENELISGHSKGYGFEPGEPFSVNHAWNAVRIDGSWRLVDPTWAAGYIDRDTREFTRNFNDHYFFTPPEQFIFDHFPEDHEWQLLGSQVSFSEYSDKVMVRPPFFQHGLRLLSEKNRVIETSGSGVVEFEVPDSRIVTARMLQNGVEVPTNQVLVHHFDGKGIVEFYPPQRGKYELQLFVRRADAAGQSFEWAASYEINNNREHADSGFPEVFGRFLEHRSMLNQPRSFLLEAGSESEFSIRVPGAVSVTVVNNKNWADLTGNDYTFTGRVTLESGPVQVAARFPDSDMYHVLLQYVAR